MFETWKLITTSRKSNRNICSDTDNLSAFISSLQHFFLGPGIASHNTMPKGIFRNCAQELISYLLSVIDLFPFLLILIGFVNFLKLDRLVRLHIYQFG